MDDGREKRLARAHARNLTSGGCHAAKQCCASVRSARLRNRGGLMIRTHARDKRDNSDTECASARTGLAQLTAGGRLCVTGQGCLKLDLACVRACVLHETGDVLLCDCSGSTRRQLGHKHVCECRKTNAWRTHSFASKTRRQLCSLCARVTLL